MQIVSLKPPEHNMVQFNTDAQSPERTAAAKSQQEIERAEGLAQLLANFEGYHDLRNQPEHIRKHFAQWALLAIRGSAFGPDQFRHAQRALAYAAQAAHDCDAASQQYVALDLKAPRNHAENFAWSLIAQRTIEAYRSCMWRNEAELPVCTEAHFVEPSNERL